MKRLLLFTLVSSSLIFAAIPFSTAESTKISNSKKKLALQEELLAKEQSVWDAYKRKDAKTLDKLLAEDYYAIEDADGETMSRAEALKSVSGLDLKAFEMKDWAIIEINEGSAIVRYKVKTEGAADQHEFVPHWSMVSSVWVKRAGKWQNLMYQETKIEQ
jgi:hypothetical protein